jgi:hypothetical protein
MHNEKTFTVVGTAINKDGTLKMRWGNDLIARIKVLVKVGCTEIDLIELPEPMIKLKAAEYLIQNRALNGAQREVVENKIAEKTKQAKRQEMSNAITARVKTRITENAPVDPRVEAFVNNA